jgi:hypothetical protein
LKEGKMLKLYGDFVEGKMIVPDTVVLGDPGEQDDVEVETEDLFVDHGGEG